MERARLQDLLLLAQEKKVHVEAMLVIIKERLEDR